MLDLDAVLPDGEACVGGLLVGGVELRRPEADVVGLPALRLAAGVGARRALAVDRAAVAVAALQAEGVEHLHLVAALHVDAAVAAVLSGVRGVLLRHHELDVQPARAELGARADVARAGLDLGRVLVQRPAGGARSVARGVGVARAPRVERTAVEEHLRSRRHGRGQIRTADRPRESAEQVLAEARVLP